MAIHKYLREFWQSKERKEVMRQRMVAWRKEAVTVRVEKPLRLDRARTIGYKAKQGYIVVRQRVNRGGRQRPNITSGRRSKHARQKMVLSRSYQTVAEERAQKKFPNLTVLNSYFLAKDGLHYWYEILFVDPEHPNIKNDKNLSNLANKKGRVQRGLTASARKSRGLKKKGKGTEKTRPSLNSRQGKGN